MDILRLILKNLRRNRRRTILTVLSITVSLFIFSALASLPGAAREMLGASASSLRVTAHSNVGLTYPLPESLERKIASMPHVRAVAAVTWFGGIYDKPSNQFPNFAVDHEQFGKIWPDWGASPEALAAFQRKRIACLVGPSTMKRFHWQVGQQIILRGVFVPVTVTLEIVGELGERAADFLIFRRDYLQEALGQSLWVNNFWIRVDSPQSIPSVIAEIDRSFRNSENETRSESEASFMGGIFGSYQSLFAAAETLGLIVVVAIMLVAANTAAMSIRERRAEVAILRSLGFTSETVFSLLIGESIFVAAAGGLLGSLGCYAVFKLLAVGASALGPLAVIKMPGWVLAQSLIIAMLIGVSSALVPAIGAARRNIVTALREAV
ncbi:MAG: ABC transporter permease [Candidatus Binataceae bacterium]